MESVIYISVDPVIFRIGPLAVGWYGLLVSLAVVTVVGWLAWQNSKHHYFSYDTIFMAALIGIPSGVIFSKLLHVIDEWGYYVANPRAILSGEGLTIWGAVIGVTLGVWIYSLVSKQFRFGLFGDVIAPGIILSQAVGRIGCTLNGCCYGIENHSPIAFLYTNPGSYGPIGQPVLPTQTIEIVYDLIIFGVLLALRGKFKREGTLFLVYWAFYAAWRLGIDFVREGTPFLFDLHQAQVIGIIILIIVIPMIIHRMRPVKTETVTQEV